MNEDTIAAIATAHGAGSIAVVRVSGSLAQRSACTLTKKEGFEPRFASLCGLYDVEGAFIDQVIVLYFKSPQSFTGEDVVEFQCHGGTIVAEQILENVLQTGVRIAEPGEFSKRAFLNGKIDLSQAEAIAQLIEAKSEDAAKILSKHLRGGMQQFVDEHKKALIELLAYAEVVIDYAEEDLPDDQLTLMLSKIDTLITALTQTLAVSKTRKGLLAGFKIAIVGRPNVGKSSLLNALLQYNRAIVSDVAGTTRDTIEESVKIGTHLVRVVDTAGIRSAQDAIEKIGIERSHKAVEESDIVLALFDASEEKTDEDDEIIALLRPYESQKHIIWLLNKSDLPQCFGSALPESALPISCKEVPQRLIQNLKQFLDSQNIQDETLLVSQRQIGAVEKVLLALNEAKLALNESALEIFSYHINEALHSLSAITKPYAYDEMLDQMFSSFCLGK